MIADDSNVRNVTPYNHHNLKERKRAESTPELSLRELLLLQRQRLEQSKQNFFLSSSPSSYAPSPIPTTITGDMTSSTLAAVADVMEKRWDNCKKDGEHNKEREHPPEAEEQKNEHDVDDGTELDNNDDSALQLTQTTTYSTHNKCQKLKNITKSPSASSSLHLFYTNIVRKIPYHGRRKHLSSNTDDEDEDVGVCDVSGGDISDDYDHCDVALKKRADSGGGTGAAKTQALKEDAAGGAGSDCDYHADVEGEAAPHEGFCETSDTGGELTTTDDIDSSMNLISNLSYNSSNSNTSIENRSSVDRSTNANNIKVSSSVAGPKKRSLGTQQSMTVNTALNAQSDSSVATATAAVAKTTTQKTGAISKATKPILCPPKGHNTSGSSPNSSDCSSSSPIPPPTSSKKLSSQPAQLAAVGRSKSFQEPGVKSHSPSPRHKKYARFFQRRRSKRSNPGKSESKNIRSNYSLDTMYQNIEITIQDEDGNYQPYDDNYATRKGRCQRRRDDLDDADDYEEDDEDKEVLKEYSKVLDNRLRPHCQTMYGGVSGGHSDDAGGDISDAASSRSRSRFSDNEHVFGKLFKRMRRLSLGWRKARYHKRRGDLTCITK